MEDLQIVPVRRRAWTLRLGKSSLFDLKVADVTDLSSRSCSSLRELLCPLHFNFSLGKKWFVAVIVVKISLFSICVLENTFFLNTVVPFSYLHTLNEDRQMLVQIVFFELEINSKCLPLWKGESEGNWLQILGWLVSFVLSIENCTSGKSAEKNGILWHWTKSCILCRWQFFTGSA